MYLTVTLAYPFALLRPVGGVTNWANARWQSARTATGKEEEYMAAEAYRRIAMDRIRANL